MNKIIVKKSRVWLHFTILNNDKAKCDICKSVLSYKGGATSNLQKHLKAKHFAVLSEQVPTSVEVFEQPQSSLQFEAMECSGASNILKVSAETAGLSSGAETAGPSSSSNLSTQADKIQVRKRPMQTTISSFSVRPATASRIKMLNEKVLNMIIKDLQPFSIVDDEGFRRLVAALDPSYKIPSRTTFSRDLMDRKYKDIIEKVKVQMSQAEFVCLTTDTWTSRSVDNYMAITAHYIDKDWILRTVLLGCFHFSNQHTSENLRNQIINVVQEWEIANKIQAIVTDNARNITSAIKLTGWSHLPCLAHTINLIVQDALKLIQPLQQKVKKIVEHFHRSTTAAEKFKEIQIQMIGKSLKLIIDVVTRWNSTYLMFSRICELQAPLEATLGILHNPVENLLESEWILLGNYCKVLKPFERVTSELSAEKSVSVAKIIPLVTSLKEFLQGIRTECSSTSNIKEALIHGMNTRFNNIEFNSLVAKATYLDPRFKRKGFDNANAVIRVKESLSTEMRRLLKEDQQMETSEMQISVASPDSDSDEDSIWKSFDAKISKSQSTLATSIIEEKQYTEEQNIKRKEDPLKWWKTREVVYPTLAKLAKKYLCNCHVCA
ncbi:E3 SUMO-protein ligase ZBED1-like [Diabrotica undecimpunctata]|uniref:E3 SUMO-protein ligase ZBED1-like n=1 Tax=Diabrotica undecimpunctata TaxID=50387 RepID=UPI003B64067C